MRALTDSENPAEMIPMGIAITAMPLIAVSEATTRPMAVIG